MIAIINYEAGNLASVSNALHRLASDYIVTDKIGELEAADGVIFPGVGHAKPAMNSLRENGLDSWLKETRKPVLGICLGMQLLFESSEEGETEGLGIIKGKLEKFDASKAKVPHMGWNTLNRQAKHPLLKSLGDRQYFYFVHSYYAPLGPNTIGACRYIDNFSAVVAKENIVGVQFHPEKSGDAGSLLLQNFLQIVEDHKRKSAKPG